MGTVRDVYEQYKIMPNLQLHQLRVAAVGKYVCSTFRIPIEEDVVVLTGLFHDMGNIIKSDFDAFPDMFKELQEKGIPYWKQVKSEFLNTYGDDEHAATVAIAKEIGLPSRVIAVMDGIGFHHIDEIIAETTYERKLAEYSDGRVGPYGVLSLRDRLDDSKKRYKDRLQKRHINADDHYLALAQSFDVLEKQIMNSADFQPHDLTDAVIAPIMAELWDYTIG